MYSRQLAPSCTCFACVAHSINSFVISVVALAIAGQHRFYDTLVNFLGLLGYWAAAYVMIILLEHLYFRRGKFELYDETHWNSPSQLPTGMAAVAAVVFSFGPVVPCMDQTWYVGPIANTTGDIGFEMAFVVSAVLYVPLRWMEIKWRGRLWRNLSSASGAMKVYNGHRDHIMYFLGAARKREER